MPEGKEKGAEVVMVPGVYICRGLLINIYTWKKVAGGLARKGWEREEKGEKWAGVGEYK